MLFFLAQKSSPATKDDASVITDLLDTLQANADRCVGMAANMIGVRKRIIVFSCQAYLSDSPVDCHLGCQAYLSEGPVDLHLGMGIVNIAMVNPVIIKKSNPYEAEEGCLSLEGVRKTTRYEKIVVEFLDRNFKKQRREYSGWTAQIIQHEIDHCDGILI